MLLYGLHPGNLSSRVTRALEKSRTYLQSHSAAAELVSIGEDGNVTLRLAVKAGGCGSTLASVRAYLEAAIQDTAPDATSIVVKWMALSDPAFVPLAQLQNARVVLTAPPERRCRRAATRYVYVASTSRNSTFAALRQFARKRASVERCEMCSQELVRSTNISSSRLSAD